MKVTPLNIDVLKRYVSAHGGKIPLRVPAGSAPHLKRCMAAGLIELDASREFFVLTSEGMLAIGANDA